jgi:integrase
MAVLGRKELVRRCAAASGISTQKCREVFGQVVAVITHELTAGRALKIDDFGTFGPVNKSNKANPHPYFRPSFMLTERLATKATSSMTIDTTPPAESLPVVTKPLRLRPEDTEMIERWLATRRRPDAVTPLDPGFWEGGPQERYWADETMSRARRFLRAFARRCPVPLLKVGLNADYTDEGLAIPARYAEVMAYAADYAARAKDRIAALEKSSYSNQGDVVWKTQGWSSFLTYGLAFYGWLERQGLRPPGSNPIAGIKRYTAIDFSAHRVAIVASWYVQILKYPGLTPREKALVYLLHNGLRASEAGRIEMRHLSLSSRQVTVTGKGRTRTVRLLPWTVVAVDAYLQSRRHSASPWLFPSTRGRHTSYGTTYGVVTAITARVFPDQARAWRRKRIRPHGFRHYYVTKSLETGMDPKALMRQTGHLSFQTLQRYNSIDDERLDREVARSAKRAWF